MFANFAKWLPMLTFELYQEQNRRHICYSTPLGAIIHCPIDQQSICDPTTVRQDFHLETWVHRHIPGALGPTQKISMLFELGTTSRLLLSTVYYWTRDTAIGLEPYKLDKGGKRRMVLKQTTPQAILPGFPSSRNVLKFFWAKLCSSNLFKFLGKFKSFAHEVLRVNKTF